MKADMTEDKYEERKHDRYLLFIGSWNDARHGISSSSYPPNHSTRIDSSGARNPDSEA